MRKNILSIVLSVLFAVILFKVSFSAYGDLISYGSSDQFRVDQNGAVICVGLTNTGNTSHTGTFGVTGNSTLTGTLAVTQDVTVTGYVNSGGYVGAIKVCNATTTLTAADIEDYTVIISTSASAVGFTLPISSMTKAGAIVTFKQTGGAVVLTLTRGVSTDKIDGATSDNTSMDADNDTITLYNDSARNDWLIIQRWIQ